MEKPAIDLLNLLPCTAHHAFSVPDTDVYLVIAAVMRFLYVHIFDQEWYCPIGRGKREFLIQLWMSMAQLHPRRGMNQFSPKR